VVPREGNREVQATAASTKDKIKAAAASLSTRSSSSYQLASYYSSNIPHTKGKAPYLWEYIIFISRLLPAVMEAVLQL
jgi:hypothetical protein